MERHFNFYDESALIERLTGGLRRQFQNVVFLVGSPIAAPTSAMGPGVPNVDGVIQLIREEFSDRPGQAAALNAALADEQTNPYQAAFSFLLGRRGQGTVNEIIRRAVIRARVKPETTNSFLSSDEVCWYLDSDVWGWALTPAAEALGKLITHYPKQFGKVVLTTNFDPLLEVSIQRSAGTYFHTNLDLDGDISHTHGMGCHVVHLHGYWYGSDTLHTPRQLGQPRPRLQDSLAALLRNALVVVCAYGGWDDSFTDALMRVVRDGTAYPEILWTFYNKAPRIHEPLAERLANGIDRGRVSLYDGIDCNRFIPALYEEWRHLSPPLERTPISAQLSDEVFEQLSGAEGTATDNPRVLEGDDEDRPPHVDICVGRDSALEAIANSDAKTIFITGIGGEGKSTVAAQYFANAQSGPTKYSLFVWRDCKEESERFENQLASIVERLSGGKISGEDLAKQDAFSIVELVIGFLRRQKVLLVFDNVDHYVDVEAKRMTRSVNLFIEALLSETIQSRAVFTCRPSVDYSHVLSFSCHLEGLSGGAALELFRRRGAQTSEDEIFDAHRLTNGHAFWLDLLAAQVVRPNQPLPLRTLLNELESNVGAALIPQTTLNSIWRSLHDRDHIVLRAMAETVRPETESQIADYVRAKLNFNKATKAIKALRALNLIVLKPRHDGEDLLELHPIVRRFIRSAYSPAERLTFINFIRVAYREWRNKFRPSLQHRPTLSTLQHWTQNAELDIEAGSVMDALGTLGDISNLFSASAYPREFCRAAHRVLAKVDWHQDYSAVKVFDQLIGDYVDCLSYLGEHNEAINVLDNYSANVPNKDARYIFYCGKRCHAYWQAGDFVEAVRWGREGRDLKVRSDLDTKYDIAHQLALAERDAGRPESALPVFLAGRTLEEVIDPADFDLNRGGPHYGNIGRCLQFMGQLDSALVCYRKSALAIEKRHVDDYIRNEGFIRTWIGELLAAKGDVKWAATFFSAARAKWEEVSPPKVTKIAALEMELHSRLEGWKVDESQSEARCLNWILGRPPQI